MDRTPRNGFRLALIPDRDSLPEAVFGYRDPLFGVDFRSVSPVPDAIFKVYKDQFVYDPRNLSSSVEYREENPEGWIHELVSFDSAYGKERVLAHLFLPSHIVPPYQTVVYFPGEASSWMPSSKGPENKRLILYETDHIPPRAEYIKETLAWLDKYLGPVI